MDMDIIIDISRKTRKRKIKNNMRVRKMISERNDRTTSENDN